MIGQQDGFELLEAEVDFGMEVVALRILELGGWNQFPVVEMNGLAVMV